MYNHAIPEFMKAIVPQARQVATQRPLRSTSEHRLTLPITRTSAYSHSFIPSTTHTWNELPTALRLSANHMTFKKSIADLMDPVEPNRFNSYGSKRGNTLHTRLRLQASSLNAHKFSFGMELSPECRCGYRSEDTNHFFLRCPLYNDARQELFQTLTLLLRRDFERLSNMIQSEILLFGPQRKNKLTSRVAITIQNFIFKTNRF